MPLKCAAKCAFGNVKFIAKRCDITTGIHVVADDVIYHLGKGFGEGLIRGDCVFAVRTDQIKNAREARYGTALIGFIFCVALIKTETEVDQFLFSSVRKNDELVGLKFVFQQLGGEGNVLYPNAKMLMYAVLVIDATVKLVGSGEDHISAMNGIKIIFHQKGNISAEVDVKLVKIVDVLFIVRNVVHGRKALFISHFNVNSVMIFHQGSEFWYIDHVQLSFLLQKLYFMTK